MKDILYKCMLKMRNSYFGTRIYIVLDAFGIRIALSRVFNFINSRNMDGKKIDMIKDSRQYYSTHKDDIKEVLSILHDKESKNTYKAMWRFRCTGRYTSLPHNSYRSQYFLNSFFNYSNGELFVDCGAFDGDTINDFKKTMKKHRIKNYDIVAFEPDEVNFENLVRNHPYVEAVMSGVYSFTGEMGFVSGDGDASRIISGTHDGNPGRDMGYVKVCSIDDIKECRNASFIKMDIEGAEQMALEGAVNVIKRNHPKLAICIYHSDEDMVKIPLMIHRLCPEYKLSIRQHSNSRAETVLYAYF